MYFSDFKQLSTVLKSDQTWSEFEASVQSIKSKWTALEQQNTEQLRQIVLKDKQIGHTFLQLSRKCYLAGL